MAAERRAGRRLLGVLILLATGGAVLSSDTISLEEGKSAEIPCRPPANILTPRMEWKFTSGTDTTLVYYDGELTASYKGRADVFPKGLRLNSVTRKDSGEYSCEVTGKDANGVPQYYPEKTQLVVLVPPSVPVAQVPTSVTTDSAVTLYCNENDASPRPTFTWFKNKILMPENPKTSPTFQNSSYTLNTSNGQLRFDPVMKTDAGEYYCEATNGQGAKQTSSIVRMEVKDVNVGGIVAAVIISLLLLALIAFAVWFAYHRGYIGKKANKKVIYSQSSETRSDKNFQQTSSFLV